MMKNIITALFFILTSSSFSQTKYYSTNGKNRLTEDEVKSNLLKIEAKMTIALGKNTYGSITVMNSEIKKDSIILNVNMNYSDKKPKTFISYPPLFEFKNQNLPHFNLKSLSGEIFSSEQLKGKPTLINFWFTQCPPCIDEMPALNKIAKKFKEDFNFIAITYNNQDDVKKFLKKHSFEFKHLVDAKKYTDQLSLKSYPMNIFLDKNGIVKYVKGGIPYKKSTDGKMIMGEGDEVIEIIQKLKEI